VLVRTGAQADVGRLRPLAAADPDRQGPQRVHTRRVAGRPALGKLRPRSARGACMTASPGVIAGETVLYTGAGGLLGRELARHLPRAHFPSHAEFDVTRFDAMDAFVGALAAASPGARLRTLVHGAAFTSPPKVDEDPLRALETNIAGTAKVVA